MSTIIVVTGWILLVAALFGAIIGLLAFGSAKWLLRSAVAAAPEFPPVTLLKPLCGAEGGLAETLEGFCSQDYPSPVQIVFGVQCADDPAIRIVDGLKTKNPSADIALVISPRGLGSNPKISNLIPMLPNAKHEVLILSDSDIRVPGDYLRKVVGALVQPGVGGVTCFYRGIALDNFWSKLAAMGIDYQFLPNAMFAVASGLARPCFGSTIALRKTVLQEIGGFEMFQNRLADDYDIGRAIVSRGYQLAYPPIVLSHMCPESNATQLFDHELRWARTIRSINGPGHAASILTHVVPLAFLGALLLGFSTPAVIALAAVGAGRAIQKWQMDRFLGQKGQSLWLLPQRDILSFVVFISSLFGRQVGWRGLRYRLDDHGALLRG
jgi:ceramide glucosyltransferase